MTQDIATKNASQQLTVQLKLYAMSCLVCVILNVQKIEIASVDRLVMKVAFVTQLLKIKKTQILVSKYTIIIVQTWVARN